MEEEVDPILAKLNAKNKPSPSPVVEEEDPILKKLNASKKKEPTTVEESSGVGGKAQPATAGTKPSLKESKPVEKSTGALEEYKRRQQNLMSAYQSQFQKETEPVINEIASKYSSQVDAKQKELQALVDSRQISVDAANKQLSDFSKSKDTEFVAEAETKQKELLPQFLEKNKTDIGKWNAIYADDFQRKDFKENRERDWYKSIWESGSAALTKDLPSAYYGTVALGASAFNKADDALEKYVKPLADQVSDKTKEGIADKIESVLAKVISFGVDESPEEIKKQIQSQQATVSEDEIKKNIVIDNLRKAIDYSNQSAESKKYLVNTLDKVKGGDFVDYLNYISAAVGQGLGQIPASIGTRGTTSIVQQIGSIYVESVQKLAEEESARTGKEVTYEDIIRQGKDDVLWPLITGFAGGLLDAYGANKLNPFNKQEMLNSFRKRAIALGKVTGTETATEAGQTVLENLGVSKATGETWAEAFKNFKWDNVVESALQGGIAAFFMGGGGQAINKGRTSLKRDQVLMAPGSFQYKPKSPAEVVSESRTTVQNTGDTQQVLDTADKILENTQQSYKPGDVVELSTKVENKIEAASDLTLSEQKSENKPVENPLNDQYEQSDTKTRLDNGVTVEASNNSGSTGAVLSTDEREEGWSKDVESTAKALANVDTKSIKKQLGIEANWDMVGESDALSGNDATLAYTQKMLPDWNRENQRGNINPNSKITYDIVRGRFGGQDQKDVVEAKDDNGVTIGVVRLDNKGGIEHIAVAPEFRDKGVADNLIKVLKENNPNLDLSKTKLRSKGFEKAFGNKIISEAYHKAKADGSNHELVKAVEELLGKENKVDKNESQTTGETSVTQSESKSPEGQVRDERVSSPGADTDVSFTQLESKAKELSDSIEQLKQDNPSQFKKDGTPKAKSKITGTYKALVDMRQGVYEQMQAGFEEEFKTRARAESEKSRIETEQINKQFQESANKDVDPEEVVFDEVNRIFGKITNEEQVTPEEVDYVNQNAYLPKGYVFTDKGLRKGKRPEIVESEPKPIEDSSSPPPATPTEIETESDSPETGKRATVKKMQESDKTTDKTKTALQEFEDYDVRTNKKQMAAAKRWIDDRGDDKALSEITKLLKTLGMPMLMKQAIRIELFDRFNTKFKDATQKGNEAKAEEYFNKMMLASKELAENATDAAQSLQYMSVLSEMLGTVSGAIRFATKEIEESRDGQLRNLKPLIKSAQDMIDEINTMSKDELLKSQKIRDLIAEFSKKAGQGKRVTSEKAVKIFGKTKEQAKKDAEAAISDLYKMVKGGKAFATVVPDPRALKLLGQWAYNRVIESGISLIEFVQEVQAKFPEFSVDDIEKAWDESAKEADKKIAEDSEREAKQAAAKSILDPKEKKEPTFEQKAKTEKKKELKKSIDSQIIKAVTDFNQGNQEAFEELASSLSEQLEISAEEISRFTESVKNLAEKKRIEIKEKTVKKYIPRKRKKDTEKKKQFYDKILELSDTGALKDTDIQDQAATIMGLPSMTPQVADKIGDFVEAIRKAPEGKFKNAAVIKMLDYIAQQQRFNLTDYMVASYKAGIFSGIDTQAINNISNAFGGMAYVFESFASNPRETIQMIKSLLNETSVAQAWNEAAMLMKTGIDPRFVEEKNRRQLEQRSRSFWGFGKGLKGKWQALDPSLEQQKKYVFRALAAGDVLATTPLSDMAQTAIFRRLAIKQKKQLTGEARKQFKVNTYIQEQMGLTEENIANAQKQAEEEYESGILGEKNDKLRDNIIKIRRDEIIRQSRNPEVVKRANDFAQAQVFVNPPNGFTGILASHLNNAIRDIPLLNALIPVVNIGANITQRGFQYTPPFALLRGAVYYGRNKAQGIDFATSIREDIDALKSGDPFMEQRVKRFVAGTLATIAVLALFHEDDEDDKNLISKLTGKDIKIHGGGPGRIGNMKPTYQKQETGWKPYSMQIGDTFIRYDLIPGYNVLFATMGEYYDAVRYGKMKKKDAIERYAWALSNSYQVVLRNSFFQSVAGTLEGVLDGNPMKFLRTLVIAPISGFAFPKFQRNLINLFDNDIYSANDFSELASRSIPILNGYTNVPMLNALGEPIEKNWWDRVELWSTRELEKEIWNQMDRQNYSLPMPSMANLSESVKADIDSQAFNNFYQYRGESIKKYYEKYKSRLDKIEDKDIYEATFDYIVEQAADEAKYKLAQKNNFTEYLKINDEPITFFYPKYKKDSNGKVKRKSNKIEEAMKEMERNMR